MLKKCIRNFLGQKLGIHKDYVPEGFFGIRDHLPEKHLPEDVFIVAYPKSGTTWFQNMLCGLVYGVDPAMGPPRLVNDLVPDVHCTRFYFRYATPMYFKTHSLPRPEFRRVVYLLRDGRDVMVSFKHFEETLRKKSLDFLNFVTREESVYPCKWHRHVEEWRGNPFDAEMLIIKYEDLLEAPVAQLERFCEFVKLSADTQHIQKVAQAARFQALRQKEEKFRGKKWPEGKYFFRRGVAGSHKDEMPPEVLRAFLSDASETLRRYGYLGRTAMGPESYQASA